MKIRAVKLKDDYYLNADDLAIALCGPGMTLQSLIEKLDKLYLEKSAEPMVKTSQSAATGASARPTISVEIPNS